MRIEETTGRVERTTPRHINDMIRRRTECSVLHHAAHPESIERRLSELDREWDIERTLEAQASGAVLTGLVLSLLRGRRWLGLSAFSGYFLLQHAVQGWCPPVAFYRRMGIRTAREIEIERCALKALRGDYSDVSRERDVAVRAQAALRAAEGLRSPAARSTSRSGETVREEETLPERRGVPDQWHRRDEDEGRGGRGTPGKGPPGFADGV